jgi:hypothetical protein
MGNVLTNLPLGNYAEASSFYAQVLDDSYHEGLSRFKRRMASRQYQVARRQVQSLGSIEEVAQWLNDNNLAVLFCPLNILVPPNRLGPLNKMDFRNFRLNDEIDFHAGMGLFGEEPVQGSGWHGEILIRDLQGNLMSLVTGLNSLGIYVSNMDFHRIDGKAYYLLDVNFLSRDWTFPDFDDMDWPSIMIDAEDDDCLEAMMADDGELDYDIDFGRTIDD